MLAFILICAAAAAAGCARTEQRQNPLLMEWDTPMGVAPYGTVLPEDWEPAVMEAMHEHDAELKAISEDAAAPDFRNVMLALDRSGDRLYRIWDALEAACAGGDTALVSVMDRLRPEMASHQDGIYLNGTLFGRVEEAWSARNASGVREIDRRLSERTYREFVHRGAALPQSDKEEIARIDRRLAECAAQFRSNVAAARRAGSLTVGEDDVAGLPAAPIETARILAESTGLEPGEYVFTPDEASMGQFLRFSPDADLRKEMLAALTGLCQKDDSLGNGRIIEEMTSLRDHKAELMGYDSYDAYRESAPGLYAPGRAASMPEWLWRQATPRVQADIDALTVMKARDTGTEDPQLDPWDMAYFKERLSRDRHAVDWNVTAPYMALDNVRQGAMNLANRLWGLTFSPTSLPTFSDGCLCLNVYDPDGSLLGAIILDLLARDGKDPEARSVTAVRRRCDPDGTVRLPVVAVTAGFPLPYLSTPSLLSLSEARSLFREFGKALSVLFADVPYRTLADPAADLREFTGLIMEKWALGDQMLRGFATHYATGEVIPKSTARHIAECDTLGAALSSLIQAADAMLDRDIHGEDPTIADIAGDPASAEHVLLQQRRSLPSEAMPSRHLASRTDLFGSAEADVSWLGIWADVMACDAIEAFRETGDLFDRKTADRLREMLGRGGSADSGELYTGFRGGDAQVIHLLRARGLVDEPKDEEEGSPGRTLLR